MTEHAAPWWSNLLAVALGFVFGIVLVGAFGVPLTVWLTCLAAVGCWLLGYLEPPRAV